MLRGVVLRSFSASRGGIRLPRGPPPPPPRPPPRRSPVPLWAVGLPVLGGAAASVVYFSNLEDAPYTGRRRFILLSERKMREYGDMSFLQLKQEYRGRILPRTHPASRTVERVGRRIAAASGDLGRSFDWEFLVIRDEQINAFVLPGGKVCVFTGLFQVTPSETDVAAVLGHEAAHALANHAGEKMSKAWIAELGAVVLFAMGFQFDWLVRAMSTFLLQLPNSRALETEADHIGLLLMAAACYDPRTMPKVFARMAAANKGKHMWEYASTHPSDETRIERQMEWMASALALFEEKGCGAEVREGLWARPALAAA